nr:acyl-homoserine-lactone synthase [Pandoraea norimbergensis]
MRVDVLRGAQMMPSTRAEIARFRHRIFVQKLGWCVPASPVAARATIGEESDEYDHDDTVYVTLRGDGDAIVGCARLLPATRHFLLGDHFRHLVDDMPAAVVFDYQKIFNLEATASLADESTRPAAVWELSRFALESADVWTPRSKGAMEQSTQGARELLRAAVFTARALGAHRLIGVTYVSLARLFARLGVPTYKLGVAYRIDGRWVAAYRIDIDTVALAALGLMRTAAPDSDNAPALPSTSSALPGANQRHMTRRMAL